jgi:hypothetical protein
MSTGNEPTLRALVDGIQRIREWPHVRGEAPRRDEEERLARELNPTNPEAVLAWARRAAMNQSVIELLTDMLKMRRALGGWREPSPSTEEVGAMLQSLARSPKSNGPQRRMNRRERRAQAARERRAPR